MNMDKPVLDRMPVKGYQDNKVAQILTDFPDSVTTETADKLEKFYLELDPATAQAGNLDYLAYLVGYSGSFWRSLWPPDLKRALIAEAHTYIWPHRGTLQVIRRLLFLFGINADIWQAGTLTLPFTLPARFGGTPMRFFVRLDITHRRSERKWKEAEGILENYAPAFVRHAVVYDRFKLGFSKLGDPLFSK